MSSLIVDFTLPFDEAIAWAEDRVSVLPSFFYGVLQSQARARAFTVSGLTAISQIEDALDGLNKVLKDGMTFDQWRKNVVADPQMLALGKARLETIFRTNIQTHYSVGRTQQHRENAAHRPFLMYDAINDSRTRPNHMALDNFIAPMNDPIWKKITPPNGFNCLLPDTEVSGDFRVGLKSFYSGPAVEIVTQSGKRLPVTANHPILTSRGFVPAHHLVNGDQLLSNSAKVNPSFSRVIDDDKSPASVQDIFNALSRYAFGVVQVTPLDLHGDARFCQSNVYVAGSDGVLMDGFRAQEVQPQQNRCLMRRCTWGAFGGVLYSISASFLNIAYKVVFSKDSFDVWNRSSDSASNSSSTGKSRFIHGYNDVLKNIVPLVGCLPCGAALASNHGGVLLYRFPFQKLRFGTATWGYASIKQNPPNGCSGNSVFVGNSFFTHAAGVIGQKFREVVGLPARAFDLSSSHKHRLLLARAALHPGIAQETIEKAITDTVLFQNLAMRHASDVIVDDVLSVRNFTFSGHVYDFQTQQGWMLANGIIVSNCRCTTISLTEAQAVKRGWKGFTEYRDKGEPDSGWDYNPADSQDAQLDKIKADRLAKANPAVAQAVDNAGMKTPNMMPLGLTADAYLNAFETAIGGYGERLIHGSRLSINNNLFTETETGKLKLFKRGREVYMEFFAQAILNPDAIYESVEPRRDGKAKTVTVLRLLRLFDNADGKTPVVVAFTLNPSTGIFDGTTAFATFDKNGQPDLPYFEKQRRGTQKHKTPPAGT